MSIPDPDARAETAPDNTAPAPDNTAPAPVELLVCVKCRRGQEIPEDGVRPGARLAAEVEAHGLPEGVTLVPVECLSNCDNGCSAVLRGGPARWTYVYGNLDEGEHAALLAEGAALYRDRADGLIPWRERPVHFRKNCIARIPPQESSS